MSASIFISYAREDFDSAKRIFEHLDAAGHSPWLDRISLLPGQNWKFEISRAIRASDFFVALLSRNSVSKRGYVQKELKEALEILDELPDSRTYIIPVRLDECAPSNERLLEIHWADLWNSFDIGMNTVLSAIARASLRPEATGESEIKPATQSLSVVVGSHLQGRSVVDIDEYFLAFSDNTVTDTRSGLMWSNRTSSDEKTWEQAMVYCQKFKDGGYNDWRGPTVAELATLFDKSRKNPQGAPVTRLIDSTKYDIWSTVETNSRYARYFGFLSGVDIEWKKNYSTLKYALPVRSPTK